MGTAFITGLLAGVGLMTIILPESAFGPDPEALVADRATGVPPNASLLARIREQEAELASLRRELASRPVEPVDLAMESEPESATEPSSRPGFIKRMEERMSRRVENLVGTYGLSEEQAAQLTDAYQKRFENLRARRRGEDVESFNLDAAIENILTDEQFARYLEDSQEEIYNRAELMATSQLVRLRQAVEVFPEQEDLVYDAIHYTAQEMMIARQTGEEFDMRSVMNERLGSILTDEQMTAFRESLDGGGPGFGPGRGP